MRPVFPFRAISSHFLLWCLWIIISLLPASVQAADPLQVFVSVLPQKHFAERVGGDQVTVVAMVQPGFSPEMYEPTAQQVAALAKASVYIRVGMPFEDAWMQRIQAVNPSMLVLDARDGLALRTLEGHEHAEGDDHADHDHAQAEKAGQTGNDPHIWVSPRMAKQMSAQLRDTFSKLRPEQSSTFAANYEHFAQELDALDAELTALFADKKHPSFMVYHPAWGYLADAYGLKQIPIEVDGKEPGAKALAEMIGHAKENQVKTIFVQPQFSQRAAMQVAEAIEGKVVSVDNLAEDYIPNLRKTARLIAGVGDE